jgi:hypothetical protein
MLGMLFKIFSPKNLVKILAFFAKTTACSWILFIITLVFEKRHFFRRKLAKITENCYLNIDPRPSRIQIKNRKLLRCQAYKWCQWSEVTINRRDLWLNGFPPQAYQICRVWSISFMSIFLLFSVVKASRLNSRLVCFDGSSFLHMVYSRPDGNGPFLEA